MSHFYGTLEGSKGLPMVWGQGTAEDGLEAVLRSPEGCVVVKVSEGEAVDGGFEDRVRIVFGRAGSEFELYEGPLGECRFEDIRTNTQEVEK